MKKILMTVMVGVVAVVTAVSCYADSKVKLAERSEWFWAASKMAEESRKGGLVLYDFNEAMDEYSGTQQKVESMEYTLHNSGCDRVEEKHRYRFSVPDLDCKTMSGKYVSNYEEVSFVNGQVQEISRKRTENDGSFLFFTYRFDGKKIFVKVEGPDKKESVSYEMNVNDGIPRVTAATLRAAKDLPQDKVPALLNLLYETNFKGRYSIDNAIMLLMNSRESQERFPKWATDKVNKGII